ncbi:hypothetical protein F4677DRAFT_134202 [Hypoxylon crocopeplum]|nr:hypothetical protein F4677DRAFT_134202 [Hypoxylon crocopeplum]
MTDRTALIEGISDLLMASAIQQSGDHRNHPIDTMNSRFEVNLRRGTARLEASNHITQSDLELEESVTRHGHQQGWRCRCRAGTSITRSAYGWFGFRLESQATQTCPIHGKKRARTYSIEAKLSPLLQGTLEFTLDILNGKRGWDIAPHLTFRAIVKRSESPIFQLLDQFIETQFTFRPFGGRYQSFPFTTNSFICEGKNGQLIPTYGDDFVADGLETLVHDIQNLIGSGQASGGDVDENGHTLLTGAIYVMSISGDAAGDTNNALSRLLQIAYISKVDPMAVSDSQHGISSYRPIYLRENSGPITAMQLLLLYSSVSIPLSIPYYSIIKNYDGWLESLGNIRPGITRLGGRQLLLTHPEAAEGMGYSDFCLAIIRRSLCDVKRLYSFDKLQSEGGRFSPPELALGWPEGLRFLVDQGCNISDALYIAIVEKDEQSAHILLSTNRPIFSCHYPNRFESSDRNYFFWMFSYGSRYKPIFQIVVDDLAKRREAVKVLALHHLTREEQNAVGVSESWVLDENGPAIYDALSRKIDVPKNLDCLSGGSPHCPRAIKTSDIDYHKMLYDAGFTNVEVPYIHHRTALPEYCETYMNDIKFPMSDDDRRKWSDAILWFLRRGACPDFGSRDISDLRWPHLLFYLAFSMRMNDIDRRFSDVCIYEFVTDGCECFCSRNGCTPPSAFWQCNCDYFEYCFRRNAYYGPGLRGSTRNLQRWTQLWNFSKIQKEHCYESICQLELFERLSMEHTCCKSKHDMKEKEEIQSEDKVAASQLEQLLRLYKKTRKLLFNCSVEDFWNIWWKTVDDILPPLLPEKACRWLEREFWADTDSLCGLTREEQSAWVPRRREDQWAAMLEAAGYGGMDFGEVIKCHFTKFLVKSKASSQRRARWRGHRLMASPKFIIHGRR